MNPREIYPPRWASGAALLRQIARIVIQHRRKVEHDKRKPAERYLSPRWVNKSRRARGCGTTAARMRLQCLERPISAIARLASSNTG